MDINMTLLGQIYAGWLPLFWISFYLLGRRNALSPGQLMFAFLVQFIPPFGILYLGLLAYFDLRRKSVGTP